MTRTQAAISSTQTVQQAQLNLQNILTAQQAGTLGSVSLIKAAGGTAVGKLVKWATFDAANIANTSTVHYVPKYALLQSPSAGGNNALYQMTKEVVDANAVVDATVHSKLLVSGYNYIEGAGGIRYVGKTSSTDVTVRHVVAGALTPLSVAVVGNAITVNLETDVGSAAISTMAEVAAEIAATPAADALVAATATGVTTTVAAALAATNLGGVLYTAKLGGVQGNSITITHTVAGANTPLTVAVVGTAITVNVATSAGSVGTSTVAQIAAAVTASAAAAALVTATATGTTTTVTVAKALTALAGGANQPLAASRFQAYAIYNVRSHSKKTGVAPSLTPVAVLISPTHADLLGL
jgi:hypothetical protein